MVPPRFPTGNRHYTKKPRRLTCSETLHPMDQRIHLIVDNFSPHGKAEVRRWCRENNVHLIWTPTNASWLNPIECQFTGVKKFVFHNSYYGDHKELADALRRYALYRNRHAKKKR